MCYTGGSECVTQEVVNVLHRRWRMCYTGGGECVTQQVVNVLHRW